MAETEEPRLPPELERVIFEFAAWGDRRATLKLLLVARRVHVWLEPLVHRVLIFEDLDDAVVARLLNPKYGPWVQALASNHGPWEQILGSCSNITDLCIWSGSDDAQTGLQALRLLKGNLRRLSLNGATFEAPLEAAQLDWLRCLTHLEMFGFAPAEVVNTLGELPCLTHFALYECYIETIVSGVLKHGVRNSKNVL
ncbi:hypothetical protein HMN09_00857600 [Mycena chlorophos]|uniref:F-box domain-containing protein n=1 Tax=Mycena chlorophos TaxID=658473 RepID=A0A8H6SSD5_MYCCL|nr:hypothetical protein HMN09_00857600 [Mycena chlorophos]